MDGQTPIEAYIARSLASDRYPNTPGSREKGGTSEKAAAKVARFDKSLRMRCLVVFEFGDFTADEVGGRLDLKPTQARPRISQLVALGFITNTGIVRANADRNDMHVYAITALGREALLQNANLAVREA